MGGPLGPKPPTCGIIGISVVRDPDDRAPEDPHAEVGAVGGGEEGEAGEGAPGGEAEDQLDRLRGAAAPLPAHPTVV